MRKEGQRREITKPKAGNCPDCGCFKGLALSCLPRTLAPRLIQDRITREFGGGEAVFYEGTPALALYSVRSGEATLSRQGRRSEAVVGVRGPGELLGMRAVLSGLPYAVTARTLVPSVLCVTPARTFFDLVNESPAFAAALLRGLAMEYRLTEEQLVARSQEAVGARTARLLIAAARRGSPAPMSDPSAIRMGRTEMAMLVGTTRETLSRTLHDFARKGILNVSRKGIRIRDPRALRRLFE